MGVGTIKGFCPEKGGYPPIKGIEAEPTSMVIGIDWVT